MKNRYLILCFFAIAAIFSSCDNKEEKKEVQKEAPKQEVVKPDTVVNEPVVEEVVPIEETVPEKRVVTVQKGEWLYDIARKEYGSMHAWRKIYEANKDIINDPNIIFPNQELVLPE